MIDQTTTSEPLEPSPAASETAPAGNAPANARAASGLTETREARLTARAIARGWLGSRFPTRSTREELLQQVNEHGADSVNLAVLANLDLLQSKKERVRAAAVKNVAMMESANQRDEMPDIAFKSQTVLNVNLAPVAVEAMTDEQLMAIIANAESTETIDVAPEQTDGN